MTIAQFHQTEFGFNLENKINSFDVIDIINRLQKIPIINDHAENIGFSLENDGRLLRVIIHHNPLPVAVAVLIWVVVGAITALLSNKALSVWRKDVENEEIRELSKAEVVSGAIKAHDEGAISTAELNQILSNVEVLYPGSSGAAGTINNSILIAAAALAAVAILKR